MPVCLHAHSWYSLRHGVCSPAVLIDRALAAGYSALALTDTNNLYGAVAFVDEARRRGLRPILGATLLQGPTQAVALIESPTGYVSLCRILSRLHLEADSCLRHLLIEQNAGLQLLVEDVALAASLCEAYGDRLHIEMVRPAPPRIEAERIAAATRLGLRLVASPAARLATPADYPTYRLVTALRQRIQIDQLPPQTEVTVDHHIPTPREFRERFGDLPRNRFRTTDDLAAALGDDVLPGKVILPQPQTSPGTLEHLRAACEDGLRQRDLAEDERARVRLDEELKVIATAGLASYLLTVHEIALAVRRAGHTMALRGSAGNCLACYLLGITDVNPLRFGLTLERFLHAGRKDLPDIDLDFDWQVRDGVIASTIARYGQKYAAQICTHQALQPRSAFRESGRLHGLSNEQISQLLLTLDRRVDNFVLDALAGSLAKAPREFPLEAARWPRLLADAARLLGRPDHLSMHPGGIVITPTPIEDHVPLQWAAKGVVVTQMEKDGVERIGLVKIDLLGNRALATVDEARRLARAEPRDIDDPAVGRMLRVGDTLGVGQLESPAMRHLLIQTQAQTLDDVILALALLRPGAAGFGVKERYIRRKLGLAGDDVGHPRLRQILPDGFGLMVYEDDALRLIRALTGLDAPEGDALRKRIAKHTEANAEELRREFLARCRQGPRPHLPPDVMDEVWDHLSKFNRYSFCKSHAVSYGLIAWRSAYLKCHHPLAFWTAALNNNMGSYARWVYVEAVRSAGLVLHGPCVNRSSDVFAIEFFGEPGALAPGGTPRSREKHNSEDSPKTKPRPRPPGADAPGSPNAKTLGGTIRTGLGAIGGLPQELRRRILDERDAAGAYRSLPDFRQRVAPGPEALALLIRAGAMDGFGLSRPVLYLQAAQPQRKPGLELFDTVPTLDWQPPDFDLKRRLRDQWRTLGFVLDVPLLSILRPTPPADRGPPVIASTEMARYCGKLVRVQGLVATARTTYTDDDRPIQFVTLQDAHGLADVTLFAAGSQLPYLTLGPYTATGVVEEQYGVYSLTAKNIATADEKPHRR